MRRYLICYDIRCPRRLGRIHRALKKRATPVQYSVFLFAGTETALQKYMNDLEKIMDPRHDDLRAYPLPERGLHLQLGAATLPEGILWSELPLAAGAHVV